MAYFRKVWMSSKFVGSDGEQVQFVEDFEELADWFPTLIIRFANFELAKERVLQIWKLHPVFLFFFLVLGFLQIRPWEINFCCCCGFAEIWSFGIRSWQLFFLLQVWLISDFDHQVCKFRINIRKGSTHLETASGFFVFVFFFSVGSSLDLSVRN